MLKNLFLGMFRLIISAVLTVNLAMNLALLNPGSQPVFALLPIAVPPVEQPSSTIPTNPQPSGTPQTQNTNKKPAESQAQRRVDRTTAQDSTPDKSQAQDQSEPAAPYDMEAVKAFNRALYGS